MPHDIFSSMTEKWTSVSPKLITGRRLTASFVFAFLLVVPLLGLALFWSEIPRPLALAAAGGLTVVVLGSWLWFWFWVPRNWASWGYAENDSELLIRGGIMFRRLVVVPYGRVQFVDVDAGPIATKLGYASVTLNTAASSSAASIPGVPTEEAHRLRDRLTELGDSRDSGL